MEIVKLINSNVAIWSFLRGDHALKQEIHLIAPKLLNDPDFLDPLENKLRLEVFKHKRSWIYEYMGDNCSFALISYTMDDLETFNTCFAEIKIKDFAKQYQKANKKNKGFTIKRSKAKADYTKSAEDVKKLLGIKEAMEDGFYCPTPKDLMRDVLDPRLGNENNIMLAANRCWIMKQNADYIVLDGNHRLTAYYWGSQLEKTFFSSELFGFYFIQNSQ